MESRRHAHPSGQPPQLYFPHAQVIGLGGPNGFFSGAAVQMMEGRPGAVHPMHVSPSSKGGAGALGALLGGSGYGVNG